ncbi:MAG: hypothetical protein ABL899_02590 [Nitrospira sp.]
MNKKYIYIAIAVIVVIVGYISYSLGFLGGKTTVESPVVQSTNSGAVVSITSLSKNSGLASVVLSNAKTITWQTDKYPSDAGVNVNLLRKVSDSPAQYDIIRTIAENTKNDGMETWKPSRGESGNDVYVEVTCSNTYQYKLGCKLGGEPIKVN